MKVIVGERGTGKTTRSLTWLTEHPTGTLLVPTDNRARELRQACAESGLTDLVPRIYAGSNTRILYGRDGPFAYDDFDLAWGFIRFSLVTITGEGEILGRTD